MMQLVFARSAWSWNSSWSSPGTSASVLRSICWIAGRTANDAQVDPGGRVDGGGRMTGVAESEAERHRETRGVRSGEQLLRIGSFALLEPGQDTSEPGPARVGAGPCALTNGQLTRARLHIACPLSTAIAGRHGSLLPILYRLSLLFAVMPFLLVSVLPVEPGPGRGFIATGNIRQMTAPAALIDAARSGDARAFEQLVAPVPRRAAGPLLPDARLPARRRGRGAGHARCAPGAASAASTSAVSSARGSTRSRLTGASPRSSSAAAGSCPSASRPARPAAEFSWLEPYPDVSPETRYLARESVELAFVAALQHLSATQRAALILRDVLGFSAAEVAEQLDTSTAAVNSALQRARKVIDSTAPTQQTVLRDLGDAAVDDIAARWADAWQAGDVDTIVAMLADDARYSMPPLPEWYRGNDEIRAFLLRDPLQSRWRFLPTTANGQIAFGTYLWDDAAGAYIPGGLDVLTLLGRTRRGDRRLPHCRPHPIRVAGARPPVNGVQNWTIGTLTAATSSSKVQGHSLMFWTPVTRAAATP